MYIQAGGMKHMPGPSKMAAEFKRVSRI